MQVAKDPHAAPIKGDKPQPSMNGVLAWRQMCLKRGNSYNSVRPLVPLETMQLLIMGTTMITDQHGHTKFLRRTNKTWIRALDGPLFREIMANTS